MKKTLTAVFISLALIFGSCSITQEYHFNKDFSGNYKFEMKMGDLMNMMQSMDTTGNFMQSMDTLDNTFGQLKQKYEEAGAKNVSAGWKDDKTTIFINFDFSDIENLNNILEKSKDDSGFGFLGNSNTGTVNFKNKGKRKLYIDFPEYDKKDSLSLKDIESMKDYMTVETVFSFDRKIKSFDNKYAKVGNDNKSIKFSGKLNDFLNEDFSYDTEIKLKLK